MDVRKWNVKRIMQLPDCCFGARWRIFTVNRISAASTEQWITAAKLPDKIVLWSILMTGKSAGSVDTYVKFALGTKAPASAAEFDTFERIFKGDMDFAESPGGISLLVNLNVEIPMRIPIETQGRRFAVLHKNAHATAADQVTYGFLISSFPREVPDWLSWGRAMIA